MTMMTASVMNLHSKMSEGLIKKIIYLQKHRAELTKWEIDLLSDRTEALKKYKTNAVATTKQAYQLGQMYKKVKLGKEIEKL